MIRILIINHYPLTRDLYEQSLSGYKNIQVVGTSKGKGELLEQIKVLSPDIIISGLYFGNESYNGLDIISEIKVHHPDIKILIVSAYYSDKLLDYFKHHSNLSYCHKGTSLAELHSAILKIHKGEVVVKYSYDNTFKDASFVILGESSCTLSDKRVEILRMLANGNVIKEIAEHLNIAEVTVIDHIKVMREKLGVHNKCELIASAFRKGIIS